MISRLNAGRMMQRMAPAARSNMPQGGLNTARMAPRAIPMPTMQSPMMASPGGGGGFDERTGVYTRPVNPMINALRNFNVAMTGGAPTAGPGMAGGILANAGQQFRNAEAMTMPTVSAPRNLTPEEVVAITSMPAPRMEAPRMEAPMPEPTMPTFDPNAALNNFNANLARIYQGGGNMDMNMVRAQQANLRNLQMDRNATQEQHDAAYRNALSELRARYPDAFAG